MIGLDPATGTTRHPSLLCDECGTGFTIDEYDARHTDDFSEFHEDCCTGHAEGCEDSPCNMESEVVAARQRRQATAKDRRKIEDRRIDYEAARRIEWSKKELDRRTQPDRRNPR